MTPRPDQVAALCWRVAPDGGVQVLLITARSTGQWIIPKGWPVPGRTLPDSAAIEAWEEAGVTGTVGPVPLGSYRAIKHGGPSPRLLTICAFPLAVQAQSDTFPEAGERRQCWLPLAAAPGQVANSGLAALLSRLAQTPGVLSSVGERLS